LYRGWEALEAFYKGTLVHRGVVTDIGHNRELFWITDHLTLTFAAIGPPTTQKSPVPNGTGDF
jgi:hypothetical protein